MSQSILRSMSKILMGALFAVLIGMLLIGLSMFGVTDMFMSRSRNAAVSVGPAKISLQEFYDEFNAALNNYNKTAKERITTQQAWDRGLQRETLNQLTTRKLIQLDADALGLAANEKDVLKTVESYKIFNNAITGKFDKDKLYSQLYRLNKRRTPKQFEQDIKDNIRLQQMVDAMLSGLVLPKDYVDNQYKFMTEQRKVRILRLTPKAIVLPPDPTDEALKAYIKEHQNKYIAPEYRKFHLLRLEISDILPDLKVTEKEVKDLFDYKIKAGQLGRAEHRSYQQLVAKDKSQAEQITDALNNGQSIAEVVKKYGLDTPLVYENAKADASTDAMTGKTAFEIEKENTARTVKGDFGSWYSVVLTKIFPEIVPDLESERANLEKEIKNNKAQQFIYETSNKIQKNMERSMTLEEAAKDVGVPYASYDYITRLGETEDGLRLTGLEYAPGIATDDIILKEIFTSDLDFDSDPFPTSKEGVAVVRVDAIKPSAPFAFDKIRTVALKDWRLEKTDEALGELSQKLLERARAGESFEALAKEINAKNPGGAQMADMMMIRAFPTPGLSRQMAVRLFEARKDQTLAGRADNGLDRILGQVEEIRPSQGAVIGDVADRLKAQGRNQLENDIQDAWQRAALKKYPTKVHTQNVRRILGIDDEEQ